MLDIESKVDGTERNIELLFLIIINVTVIVVAGVGELAICVSDHILQI
jgi:hypothetical protein